MPLHKVLFWSGFGIAVRLWQLGIEMRPLFQKQALWVYPLFATVGGSFGYWLEGVDKRQMAILAERKRSLLEKRQRRFDLPILVGQAVGIQKVNRRH
ncbi:hypothetical protein I7I51_05665 [Histoplasma capsulatum]|uniref:NADH-ubiquinone oxidoreductase 14 kDa subunit n=1 Tax=Ajellomyces capsulatus TaxID=5037 RepID=A0A8A1M6E1_AJECA|nr:hypothetical protein I7I51_05665 [Histoplasma capsulatum]